MSHDGDHIQTWCTEEGFEFSTDGGDLIEIHPGGDTVTALVGTDRAILKLRFTPAGLNELTEFPDTNPRVKILLDGVIRNRSGLFSHEIIGSDIEITATLHADGTTKHVFLTALRDLSEMQMLVEGGIVWTLAVLEQEAIRSAATHHPAPDPSEMAPATEPAPPPPEPPPAPPMTLSSDPS